MDTEINFIPGILIKSGTSYSAFCSHLSYLSYGGYFFAPATEIDYSRVAPVSVALDSPECKVSNIPATSGTLIGNIYDRLPYSKVEILIYDFEVDSSFVIQNAHLTFRGLLYQTKNMLTTRYLTIIAREDKYYFDKTAGVVCTEQCGVFKFGDKICGKTPAQESAVIDSIDGTTVTLTGALSGSDWLYNGGYIEYNELQIKIQYWESGDTLYLTSRPPDSWIGETITVIEGCDRTLTSCRRKSNESNFFGLGYSMVDFNALSEES